MSRAAAVARRVAGMLAAVPLALARVSVPALAAVVPGRAHRGCCRLLDHRRPSPGTAARHPHPGLARHGHPATASLAPQPAETGLSNSRWVPELACGRLPSGSGLDQACRIEHLLVCRSDLSSASMKSSRLRR